MVIDMRQLKALIVVLPLSFSSICLGQVSGGSGLSADNVSKIHLPESAGHGPPRPITLDEIVSFREAHEPRLSPDGKWIAFVVRQAFRDCDCYRSALYVAAAAGGAPRKLLEEDDISDVQWRPRESAVSYIRSRLGLTQLCQVPVEGGSPEVLSVPSNNNPRDPLAWAGNESYVWSHDGLELIVATTKPVPTAEVKSALQHGIRFDDRFRIGDVLPKPAYGSSELWVYNLREKRGRLLWQAPVSLGSTPPAAPVWSPDDKAVAFIFYQPNAAKTHDLAHIGVVSAGDGKFSDLVAVDTDDSTFTEKYIFRPTWAADGRRLAFVLGDPLAGKTIETVDVDTHSTRIVTGQGLANLGQTYMEWRPDDQGLVVLMDGLESRQENTGLYTIGMDGSIHRLTDTASRVSECDSVHLGQLACIVESPSEVPALATVDIKTGAVHRLARVDLNPELKGIQLGRVEQRRWVNKYGVADLGYLIYPVAYQTGKRYPLVIMSYAFDGEFMTDAGRLYTAWPVQAFARDGYAVLLINKPRNKAWLGSDFQAGSMAYGFSPLASLEAIAEELSSEGVVDRDRIGFLGHSWGGFWVEFALTHSKLIRAAEIINGGTISEPGTYWVVGSQTARIVQERVMGGPPWGATLKNYLHFSPTLNGDKVTAPLLIQASDFGAPLELEMFTALRRNGRPVEMTIYSPDGHSFTTPEHRFYSMQENLDWFEFWLSGREDSDPAKQEQYARWREMRLDCRQHGWCDVVGSR